MHVFQEQLENETRTQAQSFTFKVEERNPQPSLIEELGVDTPPMRRAGYKGLRPHCPSVTDQSQGEMLNS
jgi:hypothetical protein